ncbi:MAG: FAD binding domain-containing protein [Bradymonadia bacterium]
MLPLPPFELHHPTTVEEAVALLARYGGAARVIAGGTDLLPNLKHGLYDVEALVSLSAIEGLDRITFDADVITLGPQRTLHAIATDHALEAILPALTTAASQIAGPQLRRMGTLGGNLCLDTRCVYINQSHAWRSALGFCIKKDGDHCHVTGTGTKCVAAASNDTAPVLWTLGATVQLTGPSGVRSMPLADFYVADGVKNTVLAPDELLTGITVPRPGPHRRQAFEKLRTRQAIDFPLLDLALTFDLVEDQLSAPQMVVSAVAARPRAIKGLPEGPLDDALVEAFAQRAFDSVRPLTSLNGDPEWRRQMVKILVRRASEQATRRPRSVPESA